MRITLESDYALRIVTVLAQSDKVSDANTIAELTSVTPRFALKILRKLVQGGLVALGEVGVLFTLGAVMVKVIKEKRLGKYLKSV